MPIFLAPLTLEMEPLLVTEPLAKELFQVKKHQLQVSFEIENKILKIF